MERIAPFDQIPHTGLGSANPLFLILSANLPMAVSSPLKKYSCTVCKFARKKCRWKDDDATECERCIRIGFDCVMSDESSDADLYTTMDGDSDVQSWDTTLDEMNSAMKQLERKVAQTWWESSLEWDLSLVNGTLRLDTPIKSMEELYMFTQASMRYLSPFSGLFMKQPVRFDSTNISITLGISAVVQREELLKPRKKRIGSLAYRHTMSSEDMLPAANHSVVIDRLVMLYLEGYNPYFGLIHRSTFLNHYNTIKNPMDCAVTLAICVDALTKFRHMLNYTPYEVSMLADLFYTRCRELLYDMYEDPTRKIEVLVATSLTTFYVSDILLNHLEANRLATVAIVLSSELANYRDQLTPVQWALLQRNHVHLEFFTRQYSVIYDEKVDFSILSLYGDIEVLDDEPEETRTSLRLINEVFHFIGSPYISTLLDKVNVTFYGKPCELLLEDIVRYEPMVKSWWNSLPLSFRICNDPFEPYGYKHVEGRVPATHLVPFVTLHLITVVITSSILQPLAMPESENCATMESVQMVRSRLVSLALNSCKVIVYALKENWIPNLNSLVSFGLTALMFGIYSMEKLASCEDIQFPVELLGMMQKRLTAKAKALIPVDHEVPASMSPLMTYRKNVNRSHYQVYEQYPLPGFAMISDTLFSSINRLANQHLKIS